MAVLVIAGGTELDHHVVERLVKQGDEVRVLVRTTKDRDRWSALGAFVAVGDPEDPDLVERAAQNARTAVILSADVTQAIVANVMEAGGRAGVDRLVCCDTVIPDGVKALLAEGELSYVLLETGRRGLLRRNKVGLAQVAAAIDAADDLAGGPRLSIDVADPEQIKQLLL